MGVIVIAEAGVNHNGNLDTATRMIDAATKAGTDIVKFQTFKAENLAAKSALKADYQNITTDSAENQMDMLKKLELAPKAYANLITHCKKNNIQFLSTPFDLDSIAYLQSIDVPFWKIPSGEITNLPYLIEIARTGKDVILSTGMSTMDEVKRALKVLRENGARKITALHCNTEYPTPYADVNLRAMETMRYELGIDVGYSDHTPGIEVPIAAVALGATVIEKHFTLDKNMEGPDHKASLEPDEFAAMVKAIRNIEAALGRCEKTPSPSERKNINIARKSIVAKRAIRVGELLNDDNITTKRPGSGISPMCWFEVLGQKAIRNFEEDELIEL